MWRRLLIAAAIAASYEASAVLASLTGAGSYRTSDYPSSSGSSSSNATQSATTTAVELTTTRTSRLSHIGNSSSSSELKQKQKQRGCRPSEFLCGGITGEPQHCIAQDKFCDGEDDCGDKSDEPMYCTRKSIPSTFYCTPFPPIPPVEIVKYRAAAHTLEWDASDYM